MCEVAGGGAGKVLSGDTETRDAGWRTFDPGRVPSATCCIETVLRLRQVPDFLLVFKGYSGKAIHLAQLQNAENRSLEADIL
ncbi:MAG: hypothetical protein AAFR90_10465 [Pseudomonadota bacterium]